MIVVTGASGNVGSKVTELLLQAGAKPRLIARHDEKLRSFKERGAEIATGSIMDTEFLTQAYRGAEVVLTMMPGDHQAADVRSYQEAAAASIAEAVRASGVKHVVNLSSLGAHLKIGNGIVYGLAVLEEKLNAIPGLNVVHLRPGYLMENLLASAALVKQRSSFGNCIRPHVPFPLIAARDIAAVAAEKLLKRNFKGSTVAPLMGPRDYTMNEVAAALGSAIGRPVAYQTLTPDQVKAALTGTGLSASVADSFVGLSDGINDGMMRQGKRTKQTTTPTTIEEFAKLFAQVYASA